MTNETRKTLALTGSDSDNNDHDAHTETSSFGLKNIGPVVINSDGTISRISNWAEMSEVERQKVERLLLKRNRERLANLKGCHKGPSEDPPQSKATSDES
jgi:hypothetical protein